MADRPRTRSGGPEGPPLPDAVVASPYSGITVIWRLVNTFAVVVPLRSEIEIV
jgi:hypothetical protein